MSSAWKFLKSSMPPNRIEESKIVPLGFSRGIFGFNEAMKR